MLATFLTILQILIGLFLVFIIMLQRGKGGGLVGALGGMGGASAFGPKADIQVLKLTIGLAIAWVFVACGGIYANRNYSRGTIGKDVEVRKKVEDDTKDEKTEGDAGPALPGVDKNADSKGAAGAGDTKKPGTADDKKDKADAAEEKASATPEKDVKAEATEKSDTKAKSDTEKK